MLGLLGTVSYVYFFVLSSVFLMVAWEELQLERLVKLSIVNCRKWLLQKFKKPVDLAQKNYEYQCDVNHSSAPSLTIRMSPGEESLCIAKIRKFRRQFGPLQLELTNNPEVYDPERLIDLECMGLSQDDPLKDPQMVSDLTQACTDRWSRNDF